MRAREKIAWMLCVATAAALAAVVIAPLDIARPAPGSASAAAPDASRKDEMIAIERRLERLEGVHRSATADSASTGGRTTGEDEKTAAVERSEAGAAAEPDAASVASMEQSRIAAGTLVARAIESGYWSRRDAETWKDTAAGMSVQDRFELQRQLAVAVNDDRVKVEPGAFFR